MKQASSPRLDFYQRLGSLSEWRNQKLECLNSMQCSVCSRSFQNAQEFAHFLKRFDSKSSLMERELHVHSKFSPFAVAVVVQTSHESNKRFKPHAAVKI